MTSERPSTISTFTNSETACFVTLLRVPHLHLSPSRVSATHTTRATHGPQYAARQVQLHATSFQSLSPLQPLTGLNMCYHYAGKGGGEEVETERKRECGYEMKHCLCRCMHTLCAQYHPVRLQTSPSSVDQNNDGRSALSVTSQSVPSQPRNVISGRDNSQQITRVRFGVRDVRCCGGIPFRQFRNSHLDNTNTRNLNRAMLLFLQLHPDYTADTIHIFLQFNSIDLKIAYIMVDRLDQRERERGTRTYPLT